MPDIRIPWDQFDHWCELGLNGGDLHVYCCLLRRANKAGECWPGVDLLVSGTGRSRREVLYSLSALERAGLITRTRRRREESVVGIPHLQEVQPIAHQGPRSATHCTSKPLDVQPIAHQSPLMCKKEQVRCAKNDMNPASTHLYEPESVNQYSAATAAGGAQQPRNLGPNMTEEMLAEVLGVCWQIPGWERDEKRDTTHIMTMANRLRSGEAVLGAAQDLLLAEGRVRGEPAKDLRRALYAFARNGQKGASGENWKRGAGQAPGTAAGSDAPRETRSERLRRQQWRPGDD